MDRKRGNSLFYWRMFSIALIIFMVLALLIIPLLLSGKFNFFKVLLKDVGVFLSPESNESFEINIWNASGMNATGSNASFAERPMIGKPVQWIRKVKVGSEAGVILLPKEAENIVVKKTTDLVDVGEVESKGKSGEIVVNESIANETMSNESSINKSEGVVIINGSENISENAINWSIGRSGNQHTFGMVMNETNFFTVDYLADAIFKYTINGTYVSSFSLNDAIHENGDAFGLTMNETNFFTTDYVKGVVFKYTINGKYTGISYKTNDSNPLSITMNETNFFIMDDVDRQVYKYDTNGTYTGIKWALDDAIHGNEYLGLYTTQYGLIMNETNFFTADDALSTIFKYTINGTYTGKNFSLNDNINTPRIKQVVAMTMNETNFFVIDDADDTIYRYAIQAIGYKSGAGLTAGITGEAIGKITRITGEAIGKIARITGKVINGRIGGEIVESEVVEKEDSKEVIVEGFAEYEIEYSTPAPSIVEEVESEYRKKVIVSGPELGYENILTFTSIPEVLPVGRESSIKVYWVEQGTYEPFTAYDSNGNGILDYVEWNTPHLSNQTFEIILISKAEHLDSNRTFVEDVYSAVKERDDVWKEIPAGDYLRVTFERNLTSDKDITIYARSSNGGSIEVYERDSNEKIADFGAISKDKEYKVYLNNLVREGGQDTFDLLIKGGSVEFDYVVDPPISGCGTLNSPETIYTLDTDVSFQGTCFTITADSVILDCRGHKITYSAVGGSFEYGVFVSNANSAVVKNCTIIESGQGYSRNYGIYFERANNGSVINSTIITFGNIGRGIFLLSSINSTIIDNNITTNGGVGNGVYFLQSPNSIVSNNQITTYNDTAFALVFTSDSNASKVINNTIITFGSNGYGIILSSSFNEIINNNSITTYGAFGHGIFGSLTSNNTFFNDRIITYNDSAIGIGFNSYSNNNIFRNIYVITNYTSAYPFYLDVGAHNFSMYDSVLNASVVEVPDFNVSGVVTGGEWNLTNVTRADGISPINISWTDGANGTLNVHWYVDAYANYTNGSVAANANINAWNKNDLLKFSVLTGDNGKIAKQVLISYKKISVDGKIYTITDYNNHTFSAKSLLLETLLQSWNMTTNRNLIFTFKADPIPPAIDFIAPTFLNESAWHNDIYVNLSTNDTNDHYAFVELDNSLLGWWRMDRDASLGENDTFVYDWSGKGNNGTVNGSAIWGSGKFGGSFNFDGINDTVYLYNPKWDITGNPTKSFTISAWFYPRDTISYKGILLASNRAYPRLKQISGYWELELTGGGNFVRGGTINVNKWQHVVATYNSTSGILVLFQDSNLVASSLPLANRDTSAGNDGIIIGYAGAYYDGIIDEVLLFNRTLSLDEVKVLYNASKYKYERDFGGLRDRIYKFKAYAVDIEGNKNETELRNVLIDNIAPGINFTELTLPNGSIQRNNDIYINLSTNDTNEHYAFIELDNSLLGWWRMDRDASVGENDTHVYDWSGKGRNGTVNGSAIWGSGKFGGAYRFDGTNDFINLSVLGYDSANIKKSGLTYSAWVWFNGGIVGNNNYRIVGSSSDLLDTGYGAGGLYIYIGGGKTVATFQIYDGQGSPFTEIIAPAVGGFQAGRWYHVVGVIDEKTNKSRIYLNGVEEGNTPVYTPGINIAPFYSYIGKNVRLDNPEFFNGIIDEVMVFNRSLNVSEVRALYNASQYKYEYNFTGLNGGIHKFKGYAVDIAGNRNESDLRSVIVDTVAPNINFTEPTLPNGSIRESLYVPINVSIAEYESGLGEVIFNWNGTNYSVYDNSLVLLMNFDNRANLGENDTHVKDISIYGNNGTVNRSERWGENGKFFGGFNFDEVGDHIEIMNSSSLNFTGNFSVSAWIYASNLSARPSRRDIVTKGVTGDGGRRYEWALASTFPYNRTTFIIFNTVGGNYLTATGTTTLSNNSWYHVVGTYDSSTNRAYVYLNGVREGTASTPSGTKRFAGMANVYIGARQTQGTDLRWNGTIDEVTIWNRSLTADEIRQMYFVNLYKYEPQKWVLFLNQGKNSSDGLDFENYTYFASARDIFGNFNMTEIRTLFSDLRIVDIDDLKYQTINPGNVKDIKFSVYILAPAEASISKVNATFSRGATGGDILREEGLSCSYMGKIGSLLNYSCSIGIWYFDESGDWNVSSTVIAALPSIVTDKYTEGFVLMSEASITHQSSLSWGALLPGIVNKEVSFLLNNTGNTAFSSIFVTANNLMRQPSGAEYIPAANFRVHDVIGQSCSSGTWMSAGSNILIPGVTLPVGNNSKKTRDAASGQKELFDCLTQISSSLPSAEYTAKDANSWRLTSLPPHMEE